MNIKWYINAQGIKVKRCASCLIEYEYNYNNFPKRGEGKYSAYCVGCKKVLDKERQILHNKTSERKSKNVPFLGNDGVFYKVCKRCGLPYEHNLTNFYRCKNGQGGLSSKCKNCSREISRKINQTNWEYHLYRNAVGSSKRYNLEINIDVEYIKQLFIEQDGKCYWMGIDLVPSNQIKSLWQPSLDRLDRNVGYIKGNVVLCSFFANFGRNQNSKEVFEEFLCSIRDKLNFSLWKKVQ